MPIIATPFGELDVLTDPERFPSGTVRSAIAERPCFLSTPCGTLTPQYTSTALRKRQLPCISFHDNGMIRTLPLEEQTEVITPLGSMLAEQVSFYPSGALKRVFPLNGTLSGYWTQEDEAQLATALAVDTPMGPLEARIIALYFSPLGALRSVTLWPGEVVDVPSPLGSIRTRIGVAFYDSGALRSLEPAEAASVPTPLGSLWAFDADAHGVSGDRNSLRFHENGELQGLVTAAHALDVVLEGGRAQRITPRLRAHPCDGERQDVMPFGLEFYEEMVAICRPAQQRIIVPVSMAQAHPFFPPLPSLTAACTAGVGAW